MSNLLNKYHAYNPAGRELSIEVTQAVRPILDRYIQAGYPLAEIESVINSTINAEFAEKRLRLGMELRKQERASKKQLKLYLVKYARNFCADEDSTLNASVIAESSEEAIRLALGACYWHVKELDKPATTEHLVAVEIEVISDLDLDQKGVLQSCFVPS